jgi:subtilisin family serine protease
MILLSVLALALAALAPVGAAGAAEKEKESYVVIMAEDPLVTTEGQDNLDTQKAAKRQNELRASHAKALKASGAQTSQQVNDYTVALNGFSALLTADQAGEMEKQDGVLMVVKDEFRTRMTDSSGSFLGLDAPAGPWKTGLTGEGVVVGIIDDGIWPEHASFADDGSYAPLPGFASLPCEFGNTAHNPDDAPFTCNNKLLGARQMLATYRALIGADPDEFDSARDDNGHGTHTASTAAGNAGVEASVLGVPRGTVSGVAPRARVIAYKGLGNLGGFGSDLAAAIDQAVADGVDVINYSIGSSSFAIGPDDIAFLFAADAGVFVATSNGNSGPGAATTGSPASVPWLTSVGASTQSRFFQGSVDLGDGTSYTGASVTGGTDVLPIVDAADAGSPLCVPGDLDASEVAGKIVLCQRGAIARVAKSYAVYLAGGAGMVLFNTNDADSLNTDNHWVPSVHTNFTQGSAIKTYVSSAAEPTAQILAGDAVEVMAPTMASFSSRGPNRLSSDIIKPDITGPGVQILAGWSPFPDPGEVPGELFAAIAGTSMSSPHVAGAFALLKQAHPDWTAAMAKSALMTTAYQDVMKEDGLTPADPFDMGSGHMNPGGKTIKGSMFQPGLVYDAGLFEYAAFTCGAGLGVFTAGSCAFLESIGVPSDPSDLNLPSIGIDGIPGSQTVTRTVTSVAEESGWRTYNVSVDAPAGFSVKVSPSQIRLKKGQSATYDVTITNVSAPAGAWRFGSLTWEDTTGNYEVYSPIAVTAALFDAPAAVSGSGENGSASFDVTFGYTGPYAAAPHGLVGDAPVNGDIGQDPDQTYPSGDDSPVGVQEWPFNLSGTAYARWELVIPGDDDIDLFLKGPGGSIIASSTNGGTDELIELTLPADGTYTLVVHGWSVPSAPLPYTVSFFDVPLAAGGGTLDVTSAPTSATIGATGTITIGWAGLTSGERYLGAVSHTGDVGLMGLTLVEVTG